ncbi:MAG: ThiF family adenylyltransferase [Gammaproteobacteria bacterium]|nr:ThiF family adenylyltransferase [Gammaproteobacteria bacterium]MDH4310508.1 ThiF family adenylyltransferase [Gammaproteobacteria bacterium]MDH5271778.1 ThiF family adenylyltransferase [Gammaproteobacteria bacterium]
MQPFAFSTVPIDAARGREALADPACGGYATFEGWVRDHNEGRAVHRLEYEAYAALAEREGERIVAEAIARYGVQHAACVHRIGDLGLGEMAVWVGVSSRHRAEAFAACRYIIDEVKHRVPIWKKEHYVDGDSGWVNCERCAQPGDHASHSPAPAADRSPGHEHRHERAHVADSHPHGAPDFSRQIALPEVGVAGQQRLHAGSVLVIGAGGLGVPVLQYLAAAGVGRIGIVDGDVVEASNLHRQPLYGVTDIGKSKATVAATRLRQLNPEVTLAVHAERADSASLVDWLARYDLVVDCSDNFATKFTVNDAAVILGKPAVFASVYQYEGQLQVYLPREDWPCLRCLWPEAPRDGLVGNCAQAGVLGPVPAALGALQAMQTLKILLGLPVEGAPALHVFDLLGMHWRTLKAARNPACDHSPRELRVDAIDTAALELVYPTLAAARASGLTLVDIRESWERAMDDPARQIEWHLPLSALLQGSTALPPEGRYLIVCAHGVRSLALAEHLRSLGYAAVYSLVGGLAAVDT